MKNKKLLNILLWIARIWGAISFVFLLYMVGAHLIEALFISEKPFGEGFVSTAEMFWFLAFPISTLVGLGIAFKWHRLGGLITTVGIICFYFFRPDLILDPVFTGLAFPGLLYLIYSFLNKPQVKEKH